MSVWIRDVLYERLAMRGPKITITSELEKAHTLSDVKLLFGSQNKDRDALTALELAAVAECSKITSSLKIDLLETSPLKAALSQRCLGLCAVSSRARRANLAGNIKGGAMCWSLRASHHNFWACADH